MKKIIKNDVDSKDIKEFIAILDSYKSRKALVKEINERFCTIKITNVKREKVNLLEDTILSHISKGTKALTIQKLMTIGSVCKFIGCEFEKVSNQQKKCEQMSIEYIKLCKVLFKRDKIQLKQKKIKNIEYLIKFEKNRQKNLDKLIQKVIKESGYVL